MDFYTLDKLLIQYLDRAESIRANTSRIHIPLL
jgi:hypothetical protein